MLDPAALVAHARGLRADVVVAEGVGGLLVPLTLGYTVRDLAVDLDWPVVVAARPGLGTINHSLLTVESARAAGLDVRAVVLTPWPARRASCSAPTSRRSRSSGASRSRRSARSASRSISSRAPAPGCRTPTGSEAAVRVSGAALRLLPHRGEQGGGGRGSASRFRAQVSW